MLVIGIAILALWTLGTAVLLVFAALLLATFLVATGGWTANILGVPYGMGLSLVIVVLLVVAVGVGFAITPALAAQMTTVVNGLPPAIARLLTELAHTALGHFVTGQLGKGLGSGSALLAPLLSSLGSLANALGSIAFVTFLGLYLAVAPRLYIEGTLRLFPLARRRRIREIMVATGVTLKMFLFGRLSSMAVIVACSIVGLWLLGVPAPAALGLISGALSFVPYVGSAASAIAPTLLAYMQSPTAALYVIALYCGIHLLDGYILVPLVQRRATHLPPALTLVALLSLGLLWGILGIAVATPLCTVLLTIVRMAYVEDVVEAAHLVLPEKTKA